MNLLKAIGKTMLSVLKYLLIIVIVIGVILGFAFIGQYSNLANALGDIVIGILSLVIVLMIGWAIVMDARENYEMFVKKSSKTENTYIIDYKIISDRYRTVTGKTKTQAKDNLYKEISEKDLDNNYQYKIINIKEIN